jgi:ribosomal protein L29
MSFFSSYTEEELTELRDELKAELLAIIRGERFVSVSVAGKSFTRPIRNSSEVKKDLADVEKVLGAGNSTTYTNFGGMGQ